MIIEVLSKIISESLLSLYPVFVKKIKLPIIDQLWTRFFIYTIISLFFINFRFIIKEYITNKYYIFLSIITIIHVYTSYKGFEILESGISYTIFYTYPIFILLLSGENIHPIILLSLLGVYLLNSDEKEIDNIDTNNKYYGLFMILLSSITEAIIYLTIKKIKTNNNWNYVFISYVLGMIFLSIYLLYTKNNILQDKIQDKIQNEEFMNKEDYNKRIYIALIINGVIGLFGYLLRFYSINKLSPSIYAILSYIGIIFAYIYGILFNKEKITIKKIIGTLMVIITNVYLFLRIII